MAYRQSTYTEIKTRIQKNQTVYQNDADIMKYLSPFMTSSKVRSTNQVLSNFRHNATKLFLRIICLIEFNMS